MGIIAIVDAAIAPTSLTVTVELQNFFAVYTSLTCAAYLTDPGVGIGGMGLMDPRAAGCFVQDLSPTGTNHMAPINCDASGAALTPDTLYYVKCVAIEVGEGMEIPYDLKTQITTHDHAGDMCVSGVTIIDDMGVRTPLPVFGPIQSMVPLDLGHTTYYSFPSHVQGLTAWRFPRPTPQNIDIELTCCAGEECTFWFSLYLCRGCTGPKPDGLASQLTARGWDSGACSPKFDDEQATTAFHQSFNANGGTIVETIPSKWHEIAVVFGVNGAACPEWCVRAHGPHLNGLGCAENCPVDAAADP